MDAKYYLYLLEVGGIQDFVFSSNNLQVNVGASALVRAITDEWIKQVLAEKKTNFLDSGEGSGNAFSDAKIDQDSLDAEIIYIGGGNALILFKDTKLIGEFDKELSRRILVHAQGIKLTSDFLEVDLHKDNLRLKNAELHQKLSKKKSAQETHSSLPGLGVSARCVFSGSPASGIWEDPGRNSRRVSDGVIAKLQYLPLAKTYLDKITQAVVGFDDQKYGFISNFDDFGEKGVSSYLAIVHLDGNRMGKRIEALGSELSFPNNNRAYLKLLRDFSESCETAAKNALVATLEKLLRSLQMDEQGYFIQQKFDETGNPLPGKVKQVLPRVNVDLSQLPFRPIVFGGDDVTFICDGRLGLSLAKEYLNNYGQQLLEEGISPKRPPVGRAGIAITPSHFPFSQGYSLAEELSGNAKREGNDGTEASLDWHIGKNGIVKPLGAKREQQYKVPSGSLVMRPLKLTNASGYDFETFDFIVRSFWSSKDWFGRRNKVKALFGVMPEGGRNVASFRTLLKLPNLPSHTSIANLGQVIEEGWYGNRCYYFDALEALDFYIPVED